MPTSPSGLLLALSRLEAMHLANRHRHIWAPIQYSTSLKRRKTCLEGLFDYSSSLQFQRRSPGRAVISRRVRQYAVGILKLQIVKRKTLKSATEQSPSMDFKYWSHVEVREEWEQKNVPTFGPRSKKLLSSSWSCSCSGSVTDFAPITIFRLPIALEFPVFAACYSLLILPIAAGFLNLCTNLDEICTSTDFHTDIIQMWGNEGLAVTLTGGVGRQLLWSMDYDTEAIWVLPAVRKSQRVGYWVNIGILLFNDPVTVNLQDYNFCSEFHHEIFATWQPRELESWTKVHSPHNNLSVT